MKKTSNLTCFILGVVFGGLLILTTDYPVYDSKIKKAQLLCKNSEYISATIDLVGDVHKIQCKDGSVYIISKQKEPTPEQTDKKN